MGAREIHSTHGVHPATPGRNRHIFRCSNDSPHGILGGGTHFAHQGAAFDALPKEKQEFREGLVSVNSASSVTHPVVHTHPISGHKSVWLHLGMTGAVIERLPDDELTLDQLKTMSASAEAHLPVEWDSAGRTTSACKTDPVGLHTDGLTALADTREPQGKYWWLPGSDRNTWRPLARPYWHSCQRWG